MNNQEKAQHIGEMMLARMGDQEVEYRSEFGTVENSDLPSNWRSLCAFPERYSIKKEPRVIYVNVYLSEDDVDIYGYFTKELAESATLISAKGFPCLLAGHPIEIPEK